MIEFLSYFHVVGMILIMLFLNLTNALNCASDKEFVLILCGVFIWPIVVIYFMIKLFVTAFLFSVQEIYRIFKK